MSRRALVVKRASVRPSPLRRRDLREGRRIRMAYGMGRRASQLAHEEELNIIFGLMTDDTFDKISEEYIRRRQDGDA